MTAFDEAKELARSAVIALDIADMARVNRPFGEDFDEVTKRIMAERKAAFEAGQAAEALKHRTFLRDLLLLIRRFPNTSSVAWNPLRKMLMELFP